MPFYIERESWSLKEVEGGTEEASPEFALVLGNDYLPHFKLQDIKVLAAVLEAAATEYTREEIQLGEDTFEIDSTLDGVMFFGHDLTHDEARLLSGDFGLACLGR